MDQALAEEFQRVVGGVGVLLGCLVLAFAAACIVINISRNRR